MRVEKQARPVSLAGSKCRDRIVVQRAQRWRSGGMCCTGETTAILSGKAFQANDYQLSLRRIDSRRRATLKRD